MKEPPIPIGARVWVSGKFYTGPALVLEYDPSAPRRMDVDGSYYCHLVSNCDHELCEDEDDCIGEDCRGWYAIESEGTVDGC